MLLTACAAALACACSTSGNVGTATEDASVDASHGPGTDAAPPSGDAGPQTDATLPVTDAEVPDAADAGPGLPTCEGWDGSYESPACSECLRTRCCTSTTACENDPSCVALDTCVNDCLETGGDDAGSVSTCAQNCSDSQPQAVRDEWKAWNDCIGAQCGATSGAGPCL